MEIHHRRREIKHRWWEMLPGCPRKAHYTQTSLTVTNKKLPYGGETIAHMPQHPGISHHGGGSDHRCCRTPGCRLPPARLPPARLQPARLPPARLPAAARPAVARPAASRFGKVLKSSKETVFWKSGDRLVRDSVLQKFFSSSGFQR